MCNKAFRLFSLYLLLLFFPALVSAQNLTVSPYSIVGPGEMQYGGNTNSFGMGQVTQGIRTPYYTNALNPASYSSLTHTNIEAAGIFSLGTIQNSSRSNEVSNAGLAHINFGIPISLKKGWGFSFGLMPYSAMGYNVTSDVNVQRDSNIVPVNYNLIGKGSMTRVYVGTAIRIHKNLSAGINFNYLFGEQRSTTRLIIPPAYNMFNLEEVQKTFADGIHFEYGLQYHGLYKAKYDFCAGLTFNLQHDLNAERDYSLRTLAIGNPTFGRDTINNLTGNKGTIVLPASICFGLSLSNPDKWVAGADVSYTNWNSYRSFGLGDSLLDNVTLHAGGGMFFKNIQYLAGVRYDQGNTAFFGERIRQVGFTAGIAFPLKDRAKTNRPKINISFEYLMRGTNSKSLASESYFRFMLAISIHDKWFERYKYE